MHRLKQCWPEQHVPHGWTAGHDDADGGDDGDADDDYGDADDGNANHDFDDDDDDIGFLSLQVDHCYSDNEPIQFIYDPTPGVCVQLSPNFIVKMRNRKWQ